MGCCAAWALDTGVANNDKEIGALEQSMVAMGLETQSNIIWQIALKDFSSIIIEND